MFEDDKVQMLGRTVIGDQGGPITNIWQTTYTWNVPAITRGIGSINERVGQDVAMSGAAVGNPILVSAIGSLDLGMILQGVCSSANNVNLRAQYTGTTGAYTPGNIPVKITCIKI